MTHDTSEPSIEQRDRIASLWFLATLMASASPKGRQFLGTLTEEEKATTDYMVERYGLAAMLSRLESGGLQDEVEYVRNF